MNRILSIFLLSTAALAQESQISGIVQDSSGGRVPDAVITTVQEETGTRREARSDTTGGYSVFSVRPGIYKVTIKKEGFQTTSRTGVQIEVAQNARIDFTLQPSTVEQAITVHAETSLTETDSATVSTVVDRHLIDEIPLNGRSFQSLIALTPGVVLTRATFGEQGQFSVNGQRANANYFTIDGVSANIGVSAGITLVQSASGSLPGLGATGGTNTLASVEALEEFRVQTSRYAPEYGRMPGAQVTILTRSGTNQIHGSAYDFFRNDALDAKDWFVNAYALPKPAERQNDFGGVLGGPLVIPKLYDGHNRTFYFLSFEGLRLKQPQVESTDVPALEVRSQAPAALRTFLNAFPLPSGPENDYGFAQFNASYTDISNFNATSPRLDQIAGRFAFFARYNHAPSDIIQRLYALSNPTTTIANTDTATLGVNALITPHSNNDFRAYYSRTTGQSFSALDNFGGATPFGPAALFPSFADPANSFGGLFLQGGIKSSFYLGKKVENTQQQYNFVDTVSFLTGAHQWKLGVDDRRIATVNNPRAYDLFGYFSTAYSALGGRNELHHH